ncbi:cation transporter, partial [Bacillus sp. D-CC]
FIAVLGLLINILSAWILMRGGDVKGNLNLRSAFLHVLGDLLGSVGAIIAAAVQTFIQTSTLLAIGQGPFSSPAVMMGLAYILSL